jgi:hypothetical protein
MLRRYWIKAAVLAAGSLLLAGCGSAPARKVAAPAAGAVSAPKRERGDEKTIERLAKAHARYAAAVVHEVDGDAAAAGED